MSLNQKPGFTLEEAESYASIKYGIDCHAKKLAGERDQNFLLTTQNGPEYLLKIANASEELTFLEAQNLVLEILSDIKNMAPHLVRNKSGDQIGNITSREGTSYFVRMLSYVEGIPMGELKYHSNILLNELGRKTAKFSMTVEALNNQAFNRHFSWDLANYQETISERIKLVSDPTLEDFVNNTTEEYLEYVSPIENRLRKGVIHNDINDFNVIVGLADPRLSSDPEIKAIIDFGDMIYSYKVADIAVVIAYAMLGKKDPLATATRIVEGYSEISRLQTEEILALFTLAKMRLAISICMSAAQIMERPDDNYLLISQEPIKGTISSLGQIHPRMAGQAFLKASGQSQESNKPIRQWFQSSENAPFPIMGTEIDKKNCKVLDLSVGGSLTAGDPKLNSEEELTRRIILEIGRTNNFFGIGRYNEPRILYSSPNFAGDSFLGEESRTIHLGIDIFSPAGSPLYAPYDGEIHSFSEMPEELDYGHVIIIKHEISEKINFYTLYGHLSGESLKGLKEGQKVRRGDEIARIGKQSQNGGWTPHVHFQLITDLLDLDCDFPGVCRPSQRDLWMDVTPDPNQVLRIPGDCFPATEPLKDKTLTNRRKLIGYNLSLGYDRPLKIIRGWMQYLFDSDGQKYLDAYNNVPHIGHSHPVIADVVTRQVNILNTNTRYLHDSLTEYARLLTSTLPEQLEVCYFLNSASEANELAMRLAFAFTGGRDMIVLEGAYHGHTTSLIDISPYKHDGPGGSGPPSWVHPVKVADCYRGIYKYDDPDAGSKYADLVGDTIIKMKQSKRKLAGFIAETCPSVGGQIILPPGYLSGVYKYVREEGGICIADEVQTGYGRMGTSFYAFEEQGVVPDIVVLGKPIGNGYPIGAVITTKEIATEFDNGMEFFSTFGGSTLSCVVGKAVLEIVLKENLQENALKVGNHMLTALKRLKEKFSLIGDVRGSGLFLGIELVRDHKTFEPADREASYIVNRIRDNNILIGTDGPLRNVLKIRPPMTFSITDADNLVNSIEMILESMRLN